MSIYGAIMRADEGLQAYCGKDVLPMAFNELIKNFDNIRQLMRDFYVFGFKSRADFADKSARSYDNERRRIESWLGEYMYFRQNAGGKNCFISVDSRKIKHNPFYKALKAKSFTANDIMLHFFLLDILQAGVKLSLRELMARLDEDYLYCFAEQMTLDISTLRKKLAEYEQLGLVTTEKCGRELYYQRSSETVDLAAWQDAVSFFAETNQLGVVGSFIEDKLPAAGEVFSYKHHYLLHALESDVLLDLLAAMEQKQAVRIESCTSKGRSLSLRVLPLKIYVSTQSGRRYVLCWYFKAQRIIFCRLDNLERVLEAEPAPDYDRLYALAEQLEQKLWGVSLKSKAVQPALEHVELVVRIRAEEPYILQCLEREKRCGRVEKLDAGRYCFTADVHDAGELLPWLRTFIGRIERFSCSNKTVEEKFWQDLAAVCALYGVEKAGEA